MEASLQTSGGRAEDGRIRCGDELRRTWTEEDQAGLQGLQLNLRLEVVDLDGAEDLTHGHVQLVQTGCPAAKERRRKRTKTKVSALFLAISRECETLNANVTNISSDL